MVDADHSGTLQTLDAKKQWNTHFEAYIRELDQKKPVIWTGDLNVAPTAMGKLMIRHACGRLVMRHTARSHEPETKLEQDARVYRS